MKKKARSKRSSWEDGRYVWPRPKRISIYLFENQIKALEEIARDKGWRKRHIFFEAIQLYIGTYFQHKAGIDKRP